MKFFKCAVYVLFGLSIANLAFSSYMYRQLKGDPQVIVMPDPAIRTFMDESRTRDTQIFQGILMTHHRLGIHEPGKQPLCPICEGINKNNIKSITVKASDR